jgi:glycosyltransferase involved in cell wall biosynthesis
MIYIIIPVKNEAQIIEQSIKELDLYCAKNLNKYYIVFVNDGSTDDTFAKIIKLKSHIKSIRAVFNNRFDKGKGSALKTGFILTDAHFKFNKADIIIFFDSDGQIEPEDIKTALRLMDLYNADVVIGNKRHLYSNITYNFKRRIISNFYNLLIKIFFGLHLRDTQCGLKIFKKEALDKVIDKVNVKRFAFDLELLIALKDNNMRIADAPVFISEQLNAGSINLTNI